jgi:hypothetical protein
LALTLPLALPGHAVRVFLEKGEVRYFLMRDGMMLASEAEDPRVDRGIYLLLAELAGQQ